MNQPASHDTLDDGRDPPVFIIDDAIFDYGLKGVELALYMALAYFAKKPGGAFPSQATLAAYAGVSERTVKRTIPLLEERGVVRVERKKTRGNRYVLLKLTPPNGDTESPISATESPMRADGLGTESPQGDSAQAAIGARESPISATESPMPGELGPESPELVPESPPTNKDVVVEDSENPEGDQQQQEPPRAPTPQEIEVFREMHLAPALWETWLHHDAEHVLACALHAQAEGDNPPGLLRAMLERDSGAPKAAYIDAAKRRLNGEPSLTEEIIEKGRLFRQQHPVQLPDPSVNEPAIGPSRLTPRTLWTVVKGTLELQLNRSTFAPLQRATVKAYADGVLTVAVPAYASFKLLTGPHLTAVVQQAVEKAAGEPVRVEYVYTGPPLNPEAVAMMRQAQSPAAVAT